MAFAKRAGYGILVFAFLFAPAAIGQTYTHVHLTWNAPASNPPSGYAIWRSTVSGHDTCGGQSDPCPYFELANNLACCSFDDYSGEKDRRYFYVAAGWEMGNDYGAMYPATAGSGVTPYAFSNEANALVPGPPGSDPGPLYSGFHPNNGIWVFSGPLNPSSTDYCHYFTAAGAGCPATGLFNNPANIAYVSGMTHTFNLGCTNAAGCSGPNATYFDHGTSCPNLVFSGANSIDAIMSTVAGLGYGNNIIFSGASYLNNSATPQYYGTQAWADGLQFDCATNDPALTWQSNTFYLPGSYIFDSGHWWQMQKTSCTNTDTNDIRCLTTNGAKPACFAALTSPCNDGTGSNQGQWVIDPNGTHAPPLEFFCDSQSTGNTQYDCYQLEISGTASITAGGVATVTVTNPPTYPIGQNLVVKNVSIPAYICTAGCAVTAISSSAPWTVSYSGLAHSARGPDTLNITPGGTCNGQPNGTFTACTFGAHRLDINTQNATAAILSHQLPVPWNQVMRLGRERMFAKLGDHYQTASGNPAVGYFRVGLTKQGESNQDNITSWPCGSATTTCAGALATKMYNSYEKEFYSFMGGQLTVNQQPGISSSLCGLNGFSCNANLNTTPTITAAYANANNIGFDNNALGTNHAYTLQCYATATPPASCGTVTYGGGLPPAGALYHGGDWAGIFNTYNAAQPNTYFPLNDLQTTQESTPGSSPGTCRIGTCSNGSCSSAGVTGAMAPDPGCIDNPTVFPPPAGYPGNWPVGAQYKMNQSETYSCDVLRMLDPNYSNSHCSPLYPSSYAAQYQASASAFLSGSITAPVFTTANSVTFTKGIFGSFVVAATGFPIPTFTETGALPGGITFVDNLNGSATLSGTPSATGSTSLTFTATNTGGSANQGFTLKVNGGFQMGTGAGTGTFTYNFGNLCGPPFYLCSTTSNAVVQLPSVLPTWGDPLHGASGTSVTTNEYGTPTTIYRLTNLDNNCATSGFPDAIVSVSQAEDENHSSTDDRLVWFGATGGINCMYLLDVNGTMALTKVGRFLNTSTVAPSSLNFAFNSSTPNLLYALNGNATGAPAAELDTYDFTGATGGSGIPAPTKIFNFIQGQSGSWGTTSANCLPTGYTVQWTSQLGKSKLPADTIMTVGFSRVPHLTGTATVATNSTAVTWTGAALPTDGSLLLARITLNGALCSTNTGANCYFIASNTTNTITLTEPYTPSSCATSCTADIPSGQNSGTDVVAYMAGHGCVRWQTNTRTVTGDWQIVGGVVVDGSWSGTVPLLDTGTIHGVSISLDGAYARVGFEYCTRNHGVFGTDCTVTANSTPYIWQVGTTSVAISCDANNNGKCSGHGSMAFSHMTNASGAQTFQETVRPIAGSPNPPTNLKGNLPTCSTTGAYLSHDGLNNMDPADTGYYFETSYNTAGETGTPSAPFTCAYENEVNLVSIIGVGGPAPGGTVRRPAHTFSSGLVGTSRPQCDQSIAGFSQSGRVIYFESDGMGAFGSTAGGSCTYSTNNNGCRCEILAIKP